MAKYFVNPITPEVLAGDKLLEIAESLRNAISQKKICYTYFWKIGEDCRNKWYITAGWMEGFDPDDTGCRERLCAKIAYVPNNSLLRDYDYDFMMPYDEKTGEVWDTEVSLESGATEGSIFTDLTWLMKEFRTMVDESGKTELMAA